ncbi:MAG: hypothetical protein HY506_01035 [Candidatus Yanofskybacteria bacterium]|nr:hypothetical protein [Candidatus Yanofskybacteria bacterium]
MTIWQRIYTIPSAMLLIWKNFLFGPNGNGRPKIALLGIILIATYYTVTAFIEGGKLDAEYHRYFHSNFAFWFLGLATLFAWVFVLPAAIYLIDFKNKYGNLGAKRNL